MRTLSQRWNTLILTQSSKEMTSPSFPNQRSFLVCLSSVNGQDLVATYNPVRRTWQMFDLNFLDPQFQELSIVAASGGLICLMATLVGKPEVTFVVVNLLTRTYRELPTSTCNMRLPKFYSQSFINASMKHFSQKNTYKVMVSGMRPGQYKVKPTTQVFDSATNSWSSGNLDPCENFPYFAASGVYQEGSMWFAHDQWPAQVTYYDLNAGIWMDLKAEVPVEAENPTLVERHGSLLMAGIVEKSDPTKVLHRIFHPWALTPEKKKWEQLEQMPEMVCRSFMKKMTRNFQENYRSVGQGDHVYFVGLNGLFGVVHNIAKKTWDEITKFAVSPTQSQSASKILFPDDVFVFAPSLTAIV